MHRDWLVDHGIAPKPRPVILNTWEAVYFNHDYDTLTALADKAVESGVERFVVDDGWFGARRDDTAGLGDWQISQDVWPDGDKSLKALADYVHGKGLEFGLWFEPEMVNPDSDMFRNHPDWVLEAHRRSSADAGPHPAGRRPDQPGRVRLHLRCDGQARRRAGHRLHQVGPQQARHRRQSRR